MVMSGGLRSSTAFSFSSFGLLASPKKLRLEAEALGDVLGEYPRRSGELRPAAAGVLGQPGKFADRRRLQDAALLDLVDLLALARLGHRRLRRRDRGIDESRQQECRARACSRPSPHDVP